MAAARSARDTRMPGGGCAPRRPLRCWSCSRPAPGPRSPPGRGSPWAAKPASPTRTRTRVTSTMPYGHNLLRLARLDLLASLRLAERLEAVADLRSENLDAPRVYALYLRYRPFPERELDLQGGRIPPVFGSVPRRRYAQDNPLVSWPLTWQD